MSAYVVYTCLDSQRQALYVGQTNNLERRMREHELSSPWATQVVEVLTVPTSTRASAPSALRAATSTRSGRSTTAPATRVSRPSPSPPLKQRSSTSGSSRTAGTPHRPPLVRRVGMHERQQSVAGDGRSRGLSVVCGTNRRDVCDV